MEDFFDEKEFWRKMQFCHMPREDGKQGRCDRQQTHNAGCWGCPIADGVYEPEILEGVAIKMGNKFFEIAKKETTLSEVMSGRDKAKVKELIARYPDGITLVEMDIVNMFDNKKNAEVAVPVFAIKENPEIFFFGGAVLSRIATQWANACDGDIARASAELSECGGVKIKMMPKITKGGNNLIAVEVVG